MENIKQRLLIERIEKLTGKKVELTEYYASGPKKKNAFGWEYKERTYMDEVKSSILHMLNDMNYISEKAFGALDNNKAKFDKWCEANAKQLQEEIKVFEEGNKRASYCAEHIYDKYLKENSKDFNGQ